MADRSRRGKLRATEGGASPDRRRRGSAAAEAGLQLLDLLLYPVAPNTMQGSSGVGAAARGAPPGSWETLSGSS